MKEMVIERSIEIKGMLAAEQVRLQCQLKYQNEDSGKRAVGNIYVRGIYFDGERKRPLREIVVLDVLAPFDKLKLDEEFSVELIDSSYDVQNQMLKLLITLNVFGVLDEQEDVSMDVIIETEEASEIHNYSEDKIELVEEMNEVEEKNDTLDMFCQTENKRKYRMILLKENSVMGQK